MEQNIIIFIISPLLAVTESYFDAKEAKKGNKIDHNISAMVRVIVAFALSFVFSELRSPLAIIALQAAILTTFWAAFDISFNHFFGNNLFYMSKKRGIEGWFRKRGVDGRSFLALKGLFLSVFLLVYRYSEDIVNLFK